MASILEPDAELTHPPPSFDDFQLQASLMTTCTLLWKELSDHFTSLEQDLNNKSHHLQLKLQAFDSLTNTSLNALENRQTTINNYVNSALKTLDSIKGKSLLLISKRKWNQDEDDGEIENYQLGELHNSTDLELKLKSFCLEMNSKGLWNFITLRKKMLESLHSETPKALEDCLDPPRIVIEAMSDVFPVDKREVKNEQGNDLSWACVLLLESLVRGKERLLVTPSMKAKAKEIAETWKKSFEERGGIENVKTPDVHTFLQHLVTFGIVEKDDVDLYRKLVVGSAWRKQMPKLAKSLGLDDDMPGIIEELISRGQQVDAVHFTYEVGLVDKFPPVPLLKDFLKDAKKAASSISEDPNNSGRSALLAAKKEQSALRAVIECIKSYQLEAEFPPDNLIMRLEMLVKTKTDKRKHAETPANKRTRASNGGPMPPAKAGRSANGYVSSFPAPPTYFISPSHPQYLAAVSSYPPSPAMYGLGSRSPSYTYSPEACSPPYMGSYSTLPVNYPIYGGYCSGMAAAYQPAYY